MSLAASRVRVQQHGDGTVVGEKREVVYDERTGLLAEKRTMMAQVPIQGGGTAILVGEQVSAVATGPPGYTPQRYHQRALTFPVENQTGEGNPHSKPIGAKIFPACGCIVCLASLAIIIATATTGVLSCDPLHMAAVTSLILASLACWMSCLCCTCALKPDLKTLLFYLFGCCCVTLVLVAFVVAIGLNSFYVYGNINVLSSNPSVNITDCNFVGEPLGVAVLSYVLLILFLLFCCSAVVDCIQSTAVALDG